MRSLNSDGTLGIDVWRMEYTAKHDPGSALIATAVIGGVSAAFQYKQQKKAAKAQKKAQEAQQRAANERARRERVQQIREARIKRAQITAQAGSEGILEASGAVTGASGVTQQMYSGLQFSQQQQAYGQQASRQLQKAADAQSTGAMWGAIGGTAGSIFQAYGGYKELGKMAGAGAQTTQKATSPSIKIGQEGMPWYSANPGPLRY